MNKKRRKEITDLQLKIGMYYTELKELRDKLKEIYRKEDYANDNIPDSLRDSERAEESDNALDCMDEALENLDHAIDNLVDVVNW